MLWKHLNTETDLKVSLVRFLLFPRIIGNPLKTEKCKGVSAIFTFESFPVFLGLFSVFKKSFKSLVCWLVSPFLVPFSGMRKREETKFNQDKNLYYKIRSLGQKEGRHCPILNGIQQSFIWLFSIAASHKMASAFLLQENRGNFQNLTLSNLEKRRYIPLIQPDKGFRGYSDIAIFAWRVTWNHNWSFLNLQFEKE